MQRGLKQRLYVQAIGQGGAAGAALGYGAQKGSLALGVRAQEAGGHGPIGHLRAGVAVAHLNARDAAPAAHGRCGGAHVVHLKEGRVCRVKANGSLFAEDLEGQFVGKARAKARGFHHAQRAVAQAHVQQGDVVHIHRGHFGCAHSHGALAYYSLE